MKTSFFIKRTLAVLVMAILMLATYASFGQINTTQPYSVFAAGSTNGATALSWVIIGAHSVNGGAPLVTALNATTDKSTAKVQFYKVLRQTSVRYATNSGAVISVDSTNGFVSGDVIVIRHMVNDGYEKRTLTTMTSATNLTTTAAPYTTIPGDIVYGLTTVGAGSIPVLTNNINANVVSLSGGVIYGGQKGCPLLIEVDATTSGTLNYVTATFSDP